MISSEWLTENQCFIDLFYLFLSAIIVHHYVIFMNDGFQKMEVEAFAQQASRRQAHFFPFETLNE